MATYNLSQYQQQPPSGNVLIFGPPKTGKTTSIITIYKWLKAKSGQGGPIWVHNFDGRRAQEPLVRRLVELGATDDDLRVFDYSSSSTRLDSDMKKWDTSSDHTAWMSFLDNINKLNSSLDPTTSEWKKDLPYGTYPRVIVLDSVTAFQNLLLGAVLKDAGEFLGQKGGTDGRSLYGRAMKKMVEIVQTLRGFPSLVVFLAHETIEQNELTGEIRVDPFFQGKLAASIGAEFGVVLYSFVNQGGKYVWLVRPKERVKTAGSRFRDFPSQTEIEQDFSLIL